MLGFEFTSAPQHPLRNSNPDCQVEKKGAKENLRKSTVTGGQIYHNAPKLPSAKKNKKETRKKFPFLTLETFIDLETVDSVGVKEGKGE